MEPAQEFFRNSGFHFAISDGCCNILAYRHVGEEGVTLEKIAHLPFLGRQIDSGSAVKEGCAVQHDAALIGRQDAGNALQRDRLAAAGGTQ